MRRQSDIAEERRRRALRNILTQSMASASSVQIFHTDLFLSCQSGMAITMELSSLSASTTMVPVLLSQALASTHLRESFDIPIRMAFQPIVDLRSKTVFAYEALLRGKHGEAAATILRHVTEQNRYAFDNACRKQSMIQASQWRVQDGPARLAVNVRANIMCSPEACVERTLDLADQLHFPLSKLILEITQHELLLDYVYLNHLVEKFRGYGIHTAIDDFGSSHADLTLLAEVETDIVKIDMTLVRGLNKNPSNCLIVESIVQQADRFRIQVIAEGVETKAEYEVLSRMGVYLMQGYYFARPALAHLPPWKAPRTSWQSLQAAPGIRISPCHAESPSAPLKTANMAA